MNTKITLYSSYGEETPKHMPHWSLSKDTTLSGLLTQVLSPRQLVSLALDPSLELTITLSVKDKNQSTGVCAKLDTSYGIPVYPYKKDGD